jgi:hypothetical protein
MTRESEGPGRDTVQKLSVPKDMALPAVRETLAQVAGRALLAAPCR